MRIGIILSKVIDLFIKKSKDGSKEQEIDKLKQENYKQLIIIITMILVGICGLNEIFPKLEISPWWYSQTEKALNFLLGGN